MLREAPRLLLLTGALLASTQKAAPQSAPPDSPRALLTSAAKYYDFNSADLKPWHLKASYQLYDLKGNPTDQGTWEYWWASRKVWRSSWTRSSVQRTEWHSQDGTTYLKESGGPLRHFERFIAWELLSPLPPAVGFSSDRMKFDMKTVPVSSGQLRCIGASPQLIVNGKPQAPNNAVPSRYCFDTSAPMIRISESNLIKTVFNKIVMTQEHYLAKEITIAIGKLNVFSVSIESVDFISAADPALTPSADAAADTGAPDRQMDSPIANEVSTGMLLKKSVPVYPDGAKSAGVQGAVILAGIIAKDGHLKDIEVLASPSQALTESSINSVKRWEYTPYLLYGKPVEVETVINVIYRMGYL